MDFDRESELALAHTLCDTADAITLPAFRSRSFSVDRKADRSEVTEIDRGCEVALRTLIEASRPGHGVVGEEFGSSGPQDADLIWIIDPIDGTTNFVRGVPVYATLVALVDTSKGNDNVVLGMVSAPALGTRWWATRGGGAFRGGQRLQVSDTVTLPEAHVSITFNKGWEKLGLHHALAELAHLVARPRGFGDFWQHMLVAEGSIDAAVDAIGVARYDLAAPKIIVEEAGGRFTDRHGAETITSKSAISSNHRLHDSVLKHLQV